MKKKKIVIEFSAGSTFQDECITKVIMATLAAMQGHFHGRHKKNKMTITYTP